MRLTVFRPSAQGHRLQTANPSWQLETREYRNVLADDTTLPGSPADTHRPQEPSSSWMPALIDPSSRAALALLRPSSLRGPRSFEAVMVLQDQGYTKHATRFVTGTSAVTLALAGRRTPLRTSPKHSNGARRRLPLIGHATPGTADCVLHRSAQPRRHVKGAFINAPPGAGAPRARS